MLAERGHYEKLVKELLLRIVSLMKFDRSSLKGKGMLKEIKAFIPGRPMGQFSSYLSSLPKMILVDTPTFEKRFLDLMIEKHIDKCRPATHVQLDF